MKLDISGIIDEYLEAKKRKHKPYDSTLYASELANCLRRTWYSYLQPKETNTDALRIFEMGNLAHEKVESILKNIDKEKYGIQYILSELDYPILIAGDELVRIGGRIDSMVIFKDGTKLILEFKTIAKFDGLSRPKPEHVTQACLYMYASGARVAQIVYFEKNTFKVKSFEIRYDEDMAKRLIERARMIDKSVKTKEIPIAEAKQYRDTSWKCHYCPYQQECDEYDEVHKNTDKV